MGSGVDFELGTPPAQAVEAALQAAARSGCGKSQRGAVVFRMVLPAWPDIVGAGWNAQPAPFSCTNDARCRKHCASLCVHAELAAIRMAIRTTAGTPSEDLVQEPSGEWVMGGRRRNLRGYDILHVKAKDGKLVAGKAPCCPQCSREILAERIDGVWLHVICGPYSRDCGHCQVPHHFATDADDAEDCPRCGNELSPIVRAHGGEWRRYTAAAFHSATLASCAMGPT